MARPTSHLLDRRSCSRRRSCPTLPRCRSCRSATPATVAHTALPVPQRLQLVLTTQDAIQLTATPVNVQGIKSANGMRMRANTSRRRRAGARDTHGGRITPGREEEKVFETRRKCLQKLAERTDSSFGDTNGAKKIVQVPQPARIREPTRPTAAGPPII